MKNQSGKVLLGAATLAAIMGGGHNARAADTANVGIDAKIVAAIAVTANTNLNFATASETGAGGTLQVGANAAVTPGAGITAIGTAVAGEFQVSMTGGTPFTVDTTVDTVSLTGPGASMPVTGFVWAPTTAPTAGAAFPFTDTGAGTTAATIAYKLGGTLNINAAQAAGAYTGTIGITVAYQ